MNSQFYENALPAGTLLDGIRKGQYEISSVLGAGGFGITYKAHDHLMQSIVAIKEYFPVDLAVRRTNGCTISPRGSSQEEDYQWGLSGFLDEARTLSTFNTEPNIVRVESFIEVNGTAYMVMQYEEGQSLEQYIANKKVLTEEQINAFLCPVLDGLRAIHAKDYLHRDIKPGNISA